MGPLAARVLPVLILLFLAGCAQPGGPPIMVLQVPVAAPLAVKDQAVTRPVEVAKVVVLLAPGSRLGFLEGGSICRNVGDIFYYGGLRYGRHVDPTTLADSIGFKQVLDRKLSEAGYRTMDRSETPYNEQPGAPAELEIGGFIREIKLNGCTHPSAFSATMNTKGEAYFSVDWKFYDTKQRRVVFETSTAGSASWPAFRPMKLMEMVREAYDHAATNLLADRDMHRLLTTPANTI